MTATDVNAQPLVGGRTGWQRVTAVSVCVLVRSVSNGRQEDKTGSERTYIDCHGAALTLPAGNRYIHKSFQRVYAVRNNLSGIL